MFATQNIDNDMYLTAAIERRFYGPTNLPVINEWGDQIYVAGHEFGPTHVITADSWESAWEIWIDNLQTIEPAEIPEAYGFYTIRDETGAYWVATDNHDQACSFDRFFPQYRCTHRLIGRSYATKQDAHEFALELCGNHDLIEGYEYQSNATGTGIVNVDQYDWLCTLNEYNARRDVDEQIVPIYSFAY